jgi:hypothetical protein
MNQKLFEKIEALTFDDVLTDNIMVRFRISGLPVVDPDTNKNALTTKVVKGHEEENTFVGHAAVHVPRMPN